MRTSPYERSYGSLYEQTKDLRPVQVAAHMRKIVRQCAKDGLLPSDWTYSVRYRSYAGGCSIDITVAVPDELLALRDRYEAEHHHRYTTFPVEMLIGEYAPLAGLMTAEQTLHQIHSGYNYDGSDHMTDYFDVRYYGGVTVVDQTRYDRFYR